MKEYKKAIEIGKLARDYCAKIFNSIDQPIILTNYAYALSHHNDLEKAREYITQAYWIFKSTDRLDNAKKIIENLSLFGLKDL